MIDLSRCRELLGPDAPASDADVLALRDLVESLVELTLDSAQATADAAVEEAAS